MKVCPTCQREYPDALVFCQEDGTDLVVKERPSRALAPPNISKRVGSNKQGRRVSRKVLVGGGILVLLVIGRVWWIGSGGWINTPIGAVYPWNFPRYIVRHPSPWSWPQSSVSPSQQSNATMSGRSSVSETEKSFGEIMAERRRTIERLYQRSEQGFRDKNLDEYFCYTGPGWTFTNADQTSETLGQARAYMAKLFQSPPSGKEHTTGIRREVVKASPLIADSDGFLVHVWVVVSKSTGREVRYKQTDTWIFASENPGLLCTGEIKGVWQEDSGE
jgi:hypothetical protein